MDVTMQLETKFLRLLKPVTLGEHIDGWRVFAGWAAAGAEAECFTSSWLFASEERIDG